MLKATKPKAVKSRPPDIKPYVRASYATPKSKGSAIVPYSTPKSKQRPISPFRSSRTALDDLEYHENREALLPENRAWQQQAPATIIAERPLEAVQPVPLPAQKAVKSRPPTVPDPTRGTLELVVRVSMKNGTEAEEIFVHDRDNAKDLCNKFCVKHKITDRQKQFGLLKVLERRIAEHRRPQPQVVYQPQPAPNARAALNPDIRRRVLEIFNEVFYDYDEDDGHIDMNRYK